MTCEVNDIDPLVRIESQLSVLIPGIHLDATWHTPPSSPNTIVDQVHPKLYPWRPYHGSDLGPTHRGMDTGPLGVTCGVWQQGFGDRSFESSELRGGACIGFVPARPTDQ